jgi:hypothetical protein
LQAELRRKEKGKIKVEIIVKEVNNNNNRIKIAY